MPEISSLCVFCGSTAGSSPEYAAAAAAFGRELALRGIAMVYGGSDAGLMGITARSALEHHGRVTGIITRELYENTRNLEVSRLEVVETMHERKSLMYSQSDCFTALPGGIGTLEELLESLTWNQLGIHRKAVGVLNIGGFFDPLLALLDHLTEKGFFKPVHRNGLIASSDPGELLDALANRKYSCIHKWE